MKPCSRTNAPNQTCIFLPLRSMFVMAALCVVPPARAQTCELYPIALTDAAISKAIAGTTVLDVFNGIAPGKFGWLAWGGRR